MNKNTMYILVAVLVIVIVVAGVVVYYYLGTGGGGGGGETPTTVYTLGNATSVQFTVNSTAADVTTTIKFAGKSLDNMDLMLRADLETDGTVLSYVMFGNQTSFNNETGTWAQSDFTTDWNNWNTNQFSAYRDHSPNWMTGDGDISYDEAGSAIVVYNIVINPSIPDSFFVPG